MPDLEYQSLCCNCVHTHLDQLIMLTGYCLTDCRCDQCKRCGDLMMVKMKGQK